MDHPGQAVGDPIQPERRVAPRVRVRLSAAYEDVERQVFLPARDLSEAGVFLVASDLPPVGCPAQVTLELPSEPEILRLRGSVVRRRDTDPCGFALRFDPDATPMTSRKILQRFMARPEWPAG